jgi:hypothetical protein
MPRHTVLIMLAVLPLLYAVTSCAAAASGAWQEDQRRCMIYLPIKGGRIAIADDEGVLWIVLGGPRPPVIARNEAPAPGTRGPEDTAQHRTSRIRRRGLRRRRDACKPRIFCKDFDDLIVERTPTAGAPADHPDRHFYEGAVMLAYAGSIRIAGMALPSVHRA